MGQLPASDASLLVRTDFSDDLSWTELLRVLATASPEGFRAYVDVVDDVQWCDMGPSTVRAALPAATGAAVLFIADRVAISTPDFPVLAVDLTDDHVPFRCVASQLWSPDNNLNLGNMDFGEFAAATDAASIFRGFP